MHFSAGLVWMFLASLSCWAQGTGSIEATTFHWLATLDTVETTLTSETPEALPEAAKQLKALRFDFDHWLRSHPTVRVDLPAVASENTVQGLRAEAAQWRLVLDSAHRQVPGTPFHLGRIVVEVNDTGTASPLASSVEAGEWRLRDARTVPEALTLVPGVTLQRIGPRNETGVFVRGFDVRQVPLYLDGIPVYVPYDGYVDFSRFLTYGLAEAQVTKGFTSPLFGPNAIGGAINLISREPVKLLDLDLGMGYASGDTWNGFANVGSRWRNVFVLGSLATLTSDSFPLSGNFRPNPLQPTGERANAWQTDTQGRVRVGWTPSRQDQVVFTYANQQGEKGNPPYGGVDPLVRARFWQWPEWNKQSWAVIATKGLPGEAYLRGRFYLDRFNNLLRAYDDARYLTQLRPSSFTSPYDDDTYGTTLEAGTRVLRGHRVRGSFFFKDDTHREGNVGEPLRAFRDQNLSFGIEDTVQLGERTSAVLGFSADHLRVLNAEDFQVGQVLPFPRSDVWAYNPQAGFFHGFRANTKAHVTWARKTRLPTIKDRYSYRLGQAVPNPLLREERSDNLEVGFTQVLGGRGLVEASLFRSFVDNSTQRYFVSPNVFQLRNLGEATYQGGEIGIRGGVFSRVSMTAHYTFLSRRNESNPSLLLVDSPRHRGYASAVWTPHGRVTLLADLAYEAGRWQQNDAGVFGRAPQFATVGLSGTVRLHRGLDLQAGARNLSDRLFFFVEGYPEPGRNAYVNLRYRF